MADFATDIKAWIMEQSKYTDDELKIVNEELERDYYNFLSGGSEMLEALKEFIIKRAISKLEGK